jgi:serine/threonine protein kinase
MSPALDMWAAGCILAEMMQRKPLFPAQSDDPEGQLETIFQLCGTPTKATWPNHQNVPGFVEFSAQPRNLLTRYFRACDLHMVDLVAQLLKLDPTDRLSAKAALKHQIFKPDHVPHTSRREDLESVRRFRRTAARAI